MMSMGTGFEIRSGWADCGLGYRGQRQRGFPGKHGARPARAPCGGPRTSRRRV